MDNSKNRNNNGLGVNKMGKNIKKNPLHRTNNGNNTARQEPQPKVYNVSKNDFKDIVQKLTGVSPSHHSQDHPPRPPNNIRLQKIRPPPLTPLNRLQMSHQMPVYRASAPMPYSNAIPRPPAQFGQSSPIPLQPLTPGDLLANTALSPISAYMRSLQNSMNEPSPSGNEIQPHPRPQFQVPGIPSPHTVAFPSSRFNGSIPPMNASNYRPMPSFPSPQGNGPPILPYPTSQFLLPSPTGNMNLLSPGSPYTLLSPGIQFPSPLTPGFPFSPVAQSGIFSPGPHHPPSPGIMFPLSPSRFFPMSSPRWRDC